MKTNENGVLICEECNTELKNDPRYKGFDIYETETGEFVEERQHVCHMCNHINCEYIGD